MKAILEHLQGNRLQNKCSEEGYRRTHCDPNIAGLMNQAPTKSHKNLD